MFKRNKIYTVVTASALITLSSMSGAQESVTSVAEVEVSNSFTLTKDTDLSFGTLAVIQNLALDGGTPVDYAATLPVYRVGPDGTTGVTPAVADTTNKVSSITEITPGTPATYTISNAARFTEVFVDLNGSTGGATSTFDVDPEFTVDAADNIGLTGTLSFADTLITVASANQGDALAVGGGNPDQAPIRTDGTGSASFAVGASLSPNADARGFDDGTYSGTFNITVNY